MQAEGLVPFDPEIERTCRRIRRDQRQDMAQNFNQPNFGNQNMGEQAFVNQNAGHQNMLEQNPIEQAFVNQNIGNQPMPEHRNQLENNNHNRSLAELALPQLEDFNLSIVRPQILANNFELKPVMFQMLQSVGQFNGLPSEDPHMHLLNFVAICDSYKQYQVTEDAIRLRLFPFSLNGAARLWFNSLAPNSITTWEEMARKFMLKYFPPSRIVQFRNEITSFVQLETESFYDAWERFKELLRKCPYHGIQPWVQIQTFYNGLMSQTKSIVDAAAGGSIMTKTYDEAYELMEKLASNHHRMLYDRVARKNVPGMIQMDAYNALSAQLTALTKLMMENKSQPSAQAVQTLACDFCGNSHSWEQCPLQAETANYVGNFNRNQNNPYSNTYNPGWRNHPNFGWGGNQNGGQRLQAQAQTPPGFQPQAQTRMQQPAEKKISMEEVLMQFMQAQE